MNVIIPVILILIFIFLWWFIGKYPDVFVRIFPYMRERYLNVERLKVFSAETSNGDEAEFINENLPEKNKVIRFFRIVLSTMFFAIMIYLLFYH